MSVKDYLSLTRTKQNRQPFQQFSDGSDGRVRESPYANFREDDCGLTFGERFAGRPNSHAGSVLVAMQKSWTR